MDYRPGYARGAVRSIRNISRRKILASGERLHLNHQTRSIGIVFSRVKRRQLMFPLKKDMDPFLDEFACETAQYNDHTRTIKYTHPDGHRDDALHATNYALLLATRGHNAPRYHD